MDDGAPIENYANDSRTDVISFKILPAQLCMNTFYI